MDSSRLGFLKTTLTLTSAFAPSAHTNTGVFLGNVVLSSTERDVAGTTMRPGKVQKHILTQTPARRRDIWNRTETRSL